MEKSKSNVLVTGSSFLWHRPLRRITFISSACMMQRSRLKPKGKIIWAEKNMHRVRLKLKKSDSLIELA